MHAIELTINGALHTVSVDARTTLLDLLREQIQLTGTKKGCDHGLCGACTVAVNGERVVSCLTLAVSVDGATVLTIEGIADDDRLHPLQDAFVEHDGFQCGYCTPGQISSAHALLHEHGRGDLSAASFEDPAADVATGPETLCSAEIRERMAGNICRCGAYPNIVDAIASCLPGDRR
ncbi:(2Fe-2S)-binding protein [Mycolicibacterium brisbanense]|uniref:2Fe-2S iron-sulfur cluster binding domain-containing protein n=1 Tax=Mycolicibacterium brisbanense TaxID=146020 RepID=A0A117I4F3_9MYCO|nr:2Fe-2S iron-sulfur cluster-binding protein [Mycolicibacterium brisbanense]MCV7160723.1 2Fe-2S iron-sulfur cluster binding domain-containing protein [Mycolicibacterium brisbanense]GAS86868.1 2Fe-2S iron-sulfur cluster binding domain-containing protein [Mycolicibacterium brisbanense]